MILAMKTKLLSPSAAVIRLEHAGLTQAQIASLLEISQGCVNKIKSGQTKNVSYLTVDKLRALAESISSKAILSKMPETVA